MALKEGLIPDEELQEVGSIEDNLGINEKDTPVAVAVIEQTGAKVVSIDDLSTEKKN